jgi:hypothetical protein
MKRIILASRFKKSLRTIRVPAHTMEFFYTIFLWAIIQATCFSQTGLIVKKEKSKVLFQHSVNLAPHEFFHNYIRFKSIPGNKEKNYLSFVNSNTGNTVMNNSFKKSNSYTIMLSHGSIYDDPMFNNFKYPDFKMSEGNNLDPLEEALLEILSIGASSLSIWYYDKNYIK